MVTARLKAEKKLSKLIAQGASNRKVARASKKLQRRKEVEDKRREHQG